ncbi:MAG: energy-coupled thiamine transporter ThiT [Eubacteriales bacterium]|nr:energy-coupled thiamine transporter ThiT [Eubacteriales bacterium]
MLLQSLASLFRTPEPTAFIALGVFAVLIVVVVLLSRKKWDTRTLVLGAICVALSFLLSMIKIYTMPQGGSITPASMLPLMFFAVVSGPVYGLGAGIVYGVLQMLQDMYILNPIQVLLDYILAFTALGLAGLFKKKYVLGFTVAGLVRLLCHYLAGVFFYAEYAGDMSPWLYSLTYNASFLIPDLVICIVISVIPPVRRALLRLYDTYAPKAKPAKQPAADQK